jgi:hypothetical protein
VEDMSVMAVVMVDPLGVHHAALGRAKEEAVLEDIAVPEGKAVIISTAENPLPLVQVVGVAAVVRTFMVPAAAESIYLDKVPMEPQVHQQQDMCKAATVDREGGTAVM